MHGSRHREGTPSQHVTPLALGSADLRYRAGRPVTYRTRRGSGPVRSGHARPDAPAAAQVPATVSGIPTVTNGDTLVIRGVKVRLYGIDAPESSQTCIRAGKT